MKRSYFTTICGIGTVVFGWLAIMFPKYQIQLGATAILFTGLGNVFAKDWNVTGGTITRKEEEKDEVKSE